MSPKEKRDRLFKGGRPLVRRLEILDGEQYSKDMSVLWAAYSAGSFSWPPGMEQDQFVSTVEGMVEKFSQVWIVDDASPAFGAGNGPIALIGTQVDGMVVTAEGLPFSWATPRKILRQAVAFMQMIRHSTKVGVCFVKANRKSFNLMKHLRDYDVAHYVGRVGPEDFLFSVRGRAE